MLLYNVHENFLVEQLQCCDQTTQPQPDNRPTATDIKGQE